MTLDTTGGCSAISVCLLMSLPPLGFLPRFFKVAGSIEATTDTEAAVAAVAVAVAVVVSIELDVSLLQICKGVKCVEIGLPHRSCNTSCILFILFILGKECGGEFAGGDEMGKGIGDGVGVDFNTLFLGILLYPLILLFFYARKETTIFWFKPFSFIVLCKGV
jgi:hypothetical protein